VTATPFESNGRTTTLAEESDFLAALTTAAGGRLAVDVLGYSVNGAPIRLLRVGATVAPAYALSSSSTLWVGQQHGEEVQSREALLAWARDLAETTDPTLLAYLTAHPAFIMPTTNPDNLGVTAYNAAGVNLNRDHFKLSQPETRAIHAAINTIRPQIIHDMHTDGELVECKRTDNERYIRVDLKELRALGHRADAQGKVPAFCIEVGGEDYVIHRVGDWQELRGGQGQA